MNPSGPHQPHGCFRLIPALWIRFPAVPEIVVSADPDAVVQGTRGSAWRHALRHAG
jgi:hypothetical protein